MSNLVEERVKIAVEILFVLTAFALIAIQLDIVLIDIAVGLLIVEWFVFRRGEWKKKITSARELDYSRYFQKGLRYR